MASAASAAETIVRGFASAWSRLDFPEIIAFLHPEVVYHNIPLDPLVGKVAVETYLRNAGPFEACTWTIRELAVRDNVVLTERVDDLTVLGTQIRLPVMGTFVIEDGLIAQWRDYFDLSGYRAQWPKGARQ